MAIENKEIAEIVSRDVEAWNSRDWMAIAQIESNAAGFGFRSKGWRGRFEGIQAYAEFCKKAWAMMEHHRAELEELNTSAESNIGLAWGFWIERFKIKGRPPEQARVRFSFAFKKEADGWRMFMYHRDIQPFGSDGRYLTELTKV